MRTRFAAFLGILALAGAACGDDGGGDDVVLDTVVRGEETTTTAEETTTTAASTTTAAAGDDPVVVELLDAGDGERRELRLQLEEGAVHEYVQTMEIEQSIAGQTISMAMTMPMTVTVASVDDGVATLEAVYGEPSVEVGPGVPPEVAAQLEQGLVAMAGSTMTLQMDDRGAVLDVEADFGGPAGGLAEQLSASLSQLSSPLPEEPVGPGARWVTTSSLDLGGVTTAGTTEITLVEIGDGSAVAEFATTIEQSGAASGSGSGTGTYRYDLGAPLPATESTAESTATVQGQTLTQRIAQRLEPA